MTEDTTRTKSADELTTHDASGGGDPNTRGSTNDVLVETQPTIKPSIIWLGLTLVVGLTLVGALMTNPHLVGGPDVANLAANAVLLLTAIGVVRFAVQAYILTRTRYTVSKETVSQEYDLLLHSYSREVPIEMIRSHEHQQTRVQRLLGCGTVAVNQGLGTLLLENVPDSTRIHEVLQTRRRRVK